MGTVINAFLVGLFTFFASLVLIPYIAVFSYILVPPVILRFAYEYSLHIVAVYVSILVVLLVKYRKTELLYPIALAPSIYIVLRAPIIFALWIAS